MDGNIKLKEIAIKNRLCYNFSEMMKINNIEFDDTLSDEKSKGNFLIYDFA